LGLRGEFLSPLADSKMSLRTVKIFHAWKEEGAVPRTRLHRTQPGD
jgi:hypothetical protein